VGVESIGVVPLNKEESKYSRVAAVIPRVIKYVFTYSDITVNSGENRSN
jgi:hypothetical protein